LLKTRIALINTIYYALPKTKRYRTITLKKGVIFRHKNNWEQKIILDNMNITRLYTLYQNLKNTNQIRQQDKVVEQT